MPRVRAGRLKVRSNKPLEFQCSILLHVGHKLKHMLDIECTVHDIPLTRIILENESITSPAKLMDNKTIKISPIHSLPFLFHHEARPPSIVCGACLHWLLRPDQGQGGRPLRAEAEET